jgi:hypothetical protein
MKKLAIGCGIVLLLLAALVTALIMAAPKLFNSASGWLKTEMKNAAEQARYEAAWTPPTPEPSEQWFPEEVASWKRTTAEPFHEIPELRSVKPDDLESTPSPAPGAGSVQEEGVKKDGYRATYVLNGQRLEVKVIPATDLEKEGLLARVHGFKPLPENHGSTSSFQRGNQLEMKFGDRERVYCRPFSHWFIFMHTLDGAELKPFVESWLHAIDQQPPPSPEAPAQEPKPK